jgi:ABC-type transport system involved in multi-copper enzyme maturation permease subunit
MSIGAVFRRELLAIARRGGEPWHRFAFAASLLAVVLGVFAASFDRAEGMSIRRMARVAELAFEIMLALHAIAIVDVIGKAARCIAEENDRRTLDFLLSTRLSNSEIVVGKLAACLAAFVGMVASGLPIVLLLHRLGGVDLRVIVLFYAAIASLGFFVSSLSNWVSATAPSSRDASSRTILCIMAWFWGPFAVAFVLPRLGLSLPGWLSTVNAWLLASGPLSIVLAGRGLGASASLVHLVARMCGLQLALGLGCVTGAILLLRSAHRARAGGEARDVIGRLGILRRRRRSRPAVGDDPIFWRERYTGRPEGLARILNLLLGLAFAVMIAYPTSFYGLPALRDLLRHGYGAGPTQDDRPELNIVVRFFVPSGNNAPAGEARMDFNLFLRFVTVPLTYFLAIFAAGSAANAIANERVKETWDSLLATPLSALEILRSALLASLWKARGVLGLAIVLWTLGLATGAIHPLGYVLCLMILAAMIWFFSTWGLSRAVAARNPARAVNAGVGSATLAPMSFGLPFLVPAKFSSVLLGVASSPFLVSLAQLSYREVRDATLQSAHPYLHWIGLGTGEGTSRVLLTILIGILAPALGGCFCWGHSVAHFDRLVGRPWRGAPRGTGRLDEGANSPERPLRDVLRPGQEPFPAAEAG